MNPNLSSSQIRDLAELEQLPVESPASAPAAWDVVLDRARAQRDRYGADGVPTPVFDAMIAAMEQRDRMGASKYGMRLRPDNGQDPLREAIQEALDLCAYLACEHAERGDLAASLLLDQSIHLTLQLMRRYTGTRGERA